MPLDDTEHAARLEARGAIKVTVRHRPPGAATLQASAAHRLPPDHRDASPLDRWHAMGKLDARAYQNACALQRLYEAAGVGRSRGVAELLRVARGQGGDAYGPEDELRALIRDGGYGCQVALMLVRGELTPMTTRSWRDAVAYLHTLDALAARWDGERWHDEPA